MESIQNVNRNHLVLGSCGSYSNLMTLFLHRAEKKNPHILYIKSSFLPTYLQIIRGVVKQGKTVTENKMLGKITWLSMREILLEKGRHLQISVRNRSQKVLHSLNRSHSSASKRDWHHITKKRIAFYFLRNHNTWCIGGKNAWLIQRKWEKNRQIHRTDAILGNVGSLSFQNIF